MGDDMTKRQNIMLIMAVWLFAGIGTITGGSVSNELKPESIAARIAEHRMDDLIVKAKPGAAVHIEQLRHEFWFGAAI